MKFCLNVLVLVLYFSNLDFKATAKPKKYLIETKDGEAKKVETEDEEVTKEGEEEDVTVVIAWTVNLGVQCTNGNGATDGKILDNLDLDTCMSSCADVAGCQGVVRKKIDGYGKGKCWHKHNIDLSMCEKNSNIYDLYGNNEVSGDMTPPHCYFKSTDNTHTIQCANGKIAEIWDGCIRQGSYRVRCPKNHIPCNSLSPNGKDFSCWKDCTGHGGVKSCLLDDYVGCYKNTKEPKMYDKNTIDLKEKNSQVECQYECLKQHKESNYLGLENGSICRCDMFAPPTNSARHPNVDDFLCEENQCPGDPETHCGGTGYVKVFHILE